MKIAADDAEAGHVLHRAIDRHVGGARDAAEAIIKAKVHAGRVFHERQIEHQVVGPQTRELILQFAHRLAGAVPKCEAVGKAGPCTGKSVPKPDAAR